jgi:peptidoglycan/xylan/chitin deacetylase (PgdA/CDA1 family)
MPMGIITIAFDDGYKDTCENSARFLAENGLRATFALPSGFIGATLEGRAMMDNDHLFVLDNLGHEIASHTTQHKNLLDLSLKEGPQAVRQEMTRSKMQLTALSRQSIRSFVFPFIEANNTPYLRQMASEYYSSCRTTTEKFAFNNLPLKDPFSLIGVALTTDLSTGDLTKLVDIVAANDLWLIEVFHLVAPENTKSAHKNEPYRFYMRTDAFKEHINYIVSKGIPVMTQGEAAEKLSQK